MYNQHMDTTPLYRALIHAGAPEDEAKEAASAFSGKIDTMEKDIAELKILVRLLIAGQVIIIGILVKLLTIS